VRRAARPDADTLERRRDLNDIPVTYAQPDFRRIRHHLYQRRLLARRRAAYAADRGCRRAGDGCRRALFHCLGDERLEPRANLARRQVTGGGDKLDPERHRSLSAVAQLQHGATGYRAVVDEVEDAHLIEVENDLELGR